MIATNDLQRAYDALAGKQIAYAKAWQYYDGSQPLVYSSQRLKDVFRNIDARFSENWCAVVVDSMLDRVELDGFVVANDDASTAELNDIFERTKLKLDAFDAHLAAVVVGEAFVIVWPNEAGEIEAYYNDPLMVHAFYDADNPRQMQMAAKWWVGEDKRRYVTLYYQDRSEFYVSRNASDQVSSYKSFVPADPPTAPNPYGVIPVFHFRRERRGIKSELANIYGPQDAINKLLADMMIAAEFGAMRQRYIISASDPGDLKNAPNINWWIPAGDGQGQQTQVGQFEATDLGNYLGAIDRMAQAIAIISRTPKHYFMAQGGDPSGEALVAMEAPLNKKVTRFTKVIEPVWVQVAAFLLQLGGRTVDPSAIDAQFAPVETVQPRTKAEIRGLNVQAGLPLVTVLRDEGWTEDELAQLEEDKGAEQQTAQSSLAAALAEQQRRFDQGQRQPGQLQQQPEASESA